MPTLDEAIIFTLAQLRDSDGAEQTAAGARRSPGSTYGYDVYAPTLARKWALSATDNPTQWDRTARDASGIFFEATWELCRRGILRPGVRAISEQGVNDGGGFCLTTSGKEWLDSATEEHFVSLQPGALAAAFERYRGRFGAGYYQRAQEAIRCRNAEAWVAAVTMVGAAAESILLALAIARNGEEDSVMRAYMARDGRKGVMNMLTSQAPPTLARTLTAGMSLLSYWRDTAGHGQALAISSSEAEQALRELLSLSQFASDNWDELVRNVVRQSVA
jgi:hypothetical protein